MEKLIEFNYVIYLNDDTPGTPEEEKLKDLGINIEEENKETEKIVVYSFLPTDIVELRDTFIKYKQNWHRAVVASYLANDKVLIETPPLFITREDFKREVNEQNQKST